MHEVGLHFIGYLLAFFFAFLYIPYLAFKTGAEYTIDLGRRRDSGELEEFFAAVIPSALLNILTWLLLWFGRAVGACSWRVVPDYSVIAAAINQNHAELEAFILDSSRRNTLFTYLAAMIVVSAASGVCYGYAFQRLTERPKFRQRVPKRRHDLSGIRKALHLVVWCLKLVPWSMFELVSIFSFAVWHRIFHEEVIALYPFAVQQPWVFVRMHGDRLYYGKFIRYDKSATGDIESVTIDEVRRYCYDEVDRCLTEGRLPIARFQGSLRINTKEITDIHNVPENHFLHIQSRYRDFMIKRLGRDLLSTFAGRKQITVNDVFTQHAGGTLLTRHHYRQALRYLEDFGFISIAPTTRSVRAPHVPDDLAVIDFPERVVTAYDAFVPTLSSLD